MRVTIRKQGRAINLLEHAFYEKVGEDNGTVTFEGAIPLSFTFDSLNIEKGKRKDFCDKLKVEGGTKAVYPDRVDVTPHRRKRINVRISEEMRDLLGQYAEAHRTTISDFLRFRILEAIDRWLKAKKRGEESRRRRKRVFKQRKRDEERIYG